MLHQIAELVYPFEETGFAKGINFKRNFFAIRQNHGLGKQIYFDFSIRRFFAEGKKRTLGRLADDNREQAVFKGVIPKYIRKGGADDGADAPSH